MKQHKALALISGGLDSLLSAKIILDQGILVEGIYFFTGFVPGKHTIQCADRKDKLDDATSQLGIPIHRVDVVNQYKQAVFNPRYGYGSKQVNPCLDCKIFMVNQALQFAEQRGFDFIITGEVIGQRPMTQRRDTLHIVSRESGAKDRLLRPLCAKCLPPTLPEREKWVDREKLYDINGRSRKPQIALAKQFKLKDFPTPANDCCFLIDPNFARRWIDFKKYKSDYTLDDIALLKVGRHLRPNNQFKIIMGRDECENVFLEKYRNKFTSLYVKDFMGPLALLEGSPNLQEIELAAKLVARFSQGRDQNQVAVCVNKINGNEEIIIVEPMKVDKVLKDWYI